jgi:hypothetical protein
MAVLGSLVFGVLVQGIVLFGTLHRATLATSAAAREYGRAVVLADSPAEAEARGRLVVEQAARNHGLAPGSLQATVAGTRARGELLTVRVVTSVPVVRVPFIGAVLPAVAIPVEATHVVQVDRYRSAP